jgi:hypothetical protein
VIFTTIQGPIGWTVVVARARAWSIHLKMALDVGYADSLQAHQLKNPLRSCLCTQDLRREYMCQYQISFAMISILVKRQESSHWLQKCNTHAEKKNTYILPWFPNSQFAEFVTKVVLF